MTKLSKILNRIWPQSIILFVVILVIITNFEAGKYITGGDNLHTEFNSVVNLKRSLFSVWQEYQGLGLLGGMGHASDLPRQLFLLPLSFILPDSLIRWFWTFLTLFIGTVGAFYLIRKSISSFWTEDLLKVNLLALSGSLFYLLNLSTVQSYFTPFEVFTAHFAFLPWMILASLNYFEISNARGDKRGRAPDSAQASESSTSTGGRETFGRTPSKRKDLLILSLVMLISTPASYVPTLFVVYLLASIIVALFYFQKTRVYLFTFIKHFLVIFLINSFWLLPFIFFTLTSSDINVSAKINQMATEGIYLQNKEFGGIKDVVLLKGFWFNNIEPDLEGSYSYMMASWRSHLANPIISVIGYSLFAVVVLGVVFAIRKRSKLGLVAVGIFALSIFMLTTATPPFSWINDFLRVYVPLFGQIFRFPFTKFSILFSLSFSILFPLGILFLAKLIKRNSIHSHIAFFLVSVFLMIIFVFPIFRGNLFYQREKLKIPNEYFQTFDFFREQDPNTRIANFPQYTFWGWSFYDWGYSGSGFLWYGIEQPILDRAFDVWSPSNENYYWEINHAIYSKNPELFKSALNKYDVNWLVLDKHITSISPKSLFFEEFNLLINEIPEVKKEKEFGSIQIYSFKQKIPHKNFISSLDFMESSNPYEWSGYDQEYVSNGDYLSQEKNNKYNRFFPFRSLFTGKTIDGKNYEIKENAKNIEFVSPLPVYNNSIELEIPSLITQNSTLPISLVASREGSIITVKFRLQAPEVLLKEDKQTKSLWKSVIEKDLLTTNANTNANLKININGVSIFDIPSLKNREEKIIGTTSLTSQAVNSIVLSDAKNSDLDSVEVEGETIKDWFVQDEASIVIKNVKKGSSIIVRILKLNDAYSSLTINPVDKVNKKESFVINCDNFRKDYFSYYIKDEERKKLLELSSKNASPCISFYLPTLDHDSAYLVNVENKNITGRGLHFWVLNEDQKTPLIDTYFEKSKKEQNSQVILPPMEKFGKSYSLHLDNISIGNTASGNLIGNINIHPIPYYFITNLNLVDSSASPLEFGKQKFEVSHPNQSLYVIKPDKQEGFVLSLSQSYSPYWKAYEINVKCLADAKALAGRQISNVKCLLTETFPFIFGEEIQNHVKLNNWKNGWIVDDSNVQCPADAKALAGRQMSNVKCQIVIVFLPQYFEYIGFGLLVFTLTVLSISLLKNKRLASN